MDLLACMNSIYKDHYIHKCIVVVQSNDQRSDVLKILREFDFPCDKVFDDDECIRVAVYLESDLIEEHDFLYNQLNDVNLVIIYKCVLKTTPYNVCKLLSHQNAKGDVMQITI